MSEDQSPNKRKPYWSDVPPRKFGSMTEGEYIEERVNQFREWYDKKASSSKKSYLRMRTLTVVGGAVVPILINMSDAAWMDWITSGVSLMVVVLVSLESVFHYREQWKNYRSTEQLIAKEYFNFTSGYGAYQELDEDQAFKAFVERVENAIESENASTLNVMTTLSEGKATGDKAVNKKPPSAPPHSESHTSAG